GYRRAALFVAPGEDKPVIVHLTAIHDKPPPLPAIPPEHIAALDDMNRHILTLIWDSHATFGYGTSALSHMAILDPDTAKKWRDEELRRSDGKNDYIRLLDAARRRKTLLDT